MSTKEEYTIEGVSVSMALVDAIPVLFFAGSSIVISLLFKSPVFTIGAIFSTLAGLGKVIWKLLLAAKKKNIFLLNKQFRILMPLGFLLMLVSLVIEHNRISMTTIWANVSAFPSCIFFLLGVVGMILMCIFAKKLDSSDAKSNWIEQITNGIAQGCFFLALLCILL